MVSASDVRPKQRDDDPRYRTLASSAEKREKIEEDTKIFEMCGGKIEYVAPSYLVSEIIERARVKINAMDKRNNRNKKGSECE